jgi:hypothetical protein
MQSLDAGIAGYTILNLPPLDIHCEIGKRHRGLFFSAKSSTYVIVNVHSVDSFVERHVAHAAIIDTFETSKRYRRSRRRNFLNYKHMSLRVGTREAPTREFHDRLHGVVFD